MMSAVVDLRVTASVVFVVAVLVDVSCNHHFWYRIQEPQVPPQISLPGQAQA